MGGPANNRYGPKNAISSYLPDEFQLPDDENEFKEFYAERERITSSVLNIREIGQYQLQELLTAQTWFPIANTNTPGRSNIQRYVFRKVLIWADATNIIAPGIPSPNLPNATTGNMAHGITFQPTGFFTNIYAVSKNPSAAPGQQKYINITFASPTSSECIAIYCDDTNVYIKTGNNRSAWTQTYIILEYIKA